MILSTVGQARAEPPAGTLLKSFSFSASDLVADPSQPYMYASISGSNAVAVINTQSLSLQSIIALPGTPQDIALSADGTALYVADSTNKSIDVINTQTLSLTTSLPVATTPYSVAAGLNNRLYVLDATTTYNHIDQINALTGASTGPSYGYALYYGDLEISPDRRTLYFGEEGLSPSTLFSYDVSTTTITPLLSVETGSNGKKVVVSHNGSTVAQPDGAPYAVTLYNSSDFSALGSFDTGAYPDSMAFSPNDQIAYAALSPYPTAVDIFSTTSFQELGQISVPDYASCMETDSTGQELFVSCNGTYWGNTEIAVYSTGAAVPEPSTLILLGAGAISLLGYRMRLRRRRAVQASVSCDNDAPATLSFPSRLSEAMRRAA